MKNEYVSLRDYLAAAAMQGMLAGKGGEHYNVWELALDAYKVADAMIDIREDRANA
jgi:hypothetical protein